MVDDAGKLVKVLFCPGVSCRIPGPMIAAESASRWVCVERVHVRKHGPV